jgi:chromosome segregation ATPase
MKTLGNMDLPKILLTIAIFALCLFIFRGIQTNAQTSYNSGEIDKLVEPEVLIEFSAQLKQASTQISNLEERLAELESREKVLQNRYRDMTEEMSLLRELTQKVAASKTDDRTRSLKIEKVNRITGGRVNPHDMMVSVSQYSIAWKQIDTIMDKLDEIIHELSQIK